MDGGETRRFAQLLSIAAVAAQVGCSLADHGFPGRPPLRPWADETEEGKNASAGDIETTPPGPPKPDDPGVCGYDVHQAIATQPNLYFVLDASKSMDGDWGMYHSKYDVLTTAVVELVRSLGPVVSVGAALVHVPEG